MTLQYCYTYFSSVLTTISPVVGWFTNNVALSPVLACSILFFHWANHKLSNVTKAVANLLYILTILLKSPNWFIALLSRNTFIGSSILLRSCLDQWMAPAAGGAFLTICGLSYIINYYTLCKFLQGYLYWQYLTYILKIFFIEW